MKKLLVNVLVLVGVVMLTSCGGGGDDISSLTGTPALNAPSTSPSGAGGSYTPTNFYSHYTIPGTTGYNPNNQFLTGSSLSAGGYGTVIAIVDAPGSPAATVISDLAKFSAAYGLPTLTTCTSTTSGLGSGCNPSTPFITVIDMSGGATTSSTYSDWQGEIALDTQWAHAFAPRASIVLVIAPSDSNLAAGQALAASLSNVVAVSMSYGGNEPSSSYDAYYDAKFKSQIASYGVTFLAATGDAGDWGSNKSYPAASPYVTAVGGTSTSSIAGVGETAWANGGGGPSIYEAIPSYQSSYLSSQGGSSFVGSIATGSCSGSPSVCTATMTVSSITAGTLSVGNYIVGSKVISGSYISALGTGSGKTGTYIITTPTAQTTAVAANTSISACGGFNSSGVSNGLAGRLCTLAGYRGMPDVSANADPGTYGNWTASIAAGSYLMAVTAQNASYLNISPGMALYNASSVPLTGKSLFTSTGIATTTATSSALVIVIPQSGTNTGGIGNYVVMPVNCLNNLLNTTSTPSYSAIIKQAASCMTSYSGLTSATNNVQGYMESAVPYYLNGTLGYIGGTSEATPMWAGIVAQMASNYSGSYGSGVNGWKSLIKAQTGGYGFNAYLYGSGQIGNTINDVILGTNYTDATGSKTSGCAQFCQADVGWDAVTGLGSPNVTALINYLK